MCVWERGAYNEVKDGNEENHCGTLGESKKVIALVPGNLATIQ
jgi:hypothetical protein